MGTISRRSLIVGAPLAVLSVTALTPAAQARGRYQFVAEDGTTVLSSVGLQSWYDHGTFKVELYITPTNSEIEALREYQADWPDVLDWSHVDLEFTVLDLDTGDDEVRYHTDQSGFVRVIDSVVSSGSSPTVRMIGFNLGRWQPGREITVTVEIDGWSDYDYPLVAVDMMSTVYWPDNGRCEVMPGLESNQGADLCGMYGRRYRLTDRYGETEF